MKNIIKYSAVAAILLVMLILVSANTSDRPAQSETDQVTEQNTYQGVAMEDKDSW